MALIVMERLSALFWSLCSMKILVLLSLVGVASSISFNDVLNDAIKGLGSLDSIMSMKDADDEIKTELGKKLRERLDDLLEKIKDAIDHGKLVKEDFIKKLKEVREKLKDLNIEIRKKAKELAEKVRERYKNFLSELFDKLKDGDLQQTLSTEDETELFVFNIDYLFE